MKVAPKMLKSVMRRPVRPCGFYCVWVLGDFAWGERAVAFGRGVVQNARRHTARELP